MAEISESFALKVLVVEDDFSFALDLRMLVEELGYRCQGIVDSGEKALEHIARELPDVILMDIDLKGQLNGMDLAIQIKDLHIPTLFITSYKDPDTYNKAKEAGMVGFLVKPLSHYTLLSSIDACISQYRKELAIKATKENQSNKTELIPGAILIKKSKLYHKVRLKDIYFLSSDLEYTTIHTINGKFAFRESLSKMHNLLSSNEFFRTHKSYIVQLDYVKSINFEEGEVILANDMKVPLSRRNKKELENYWTTLN